MIAASICRNADRFFDVSSSTTPNGVGAVVCYWVAIGGKADEGRTNKIDVDDPDSSRT